MSSIYFNQTCTISPYDNYDSNVVNRLNRAVTYGKNCIQGTHSFEVTQDATSTNNIVVVSPGKCYIDDVIIENFEYFEVNLEDSVFYLSSPYWNEAGNYYIVADYVYQKSRPAPKCSIKIIKPSERTTLFNPDRYLLLKVVKVIFNGSTFEIDSLADYDPEYPDNHRVYADVYVGAEDTLPDFSFSRDEGRVIYVKDLDELFFGTSQQWESFNSVRENFDTSKLSLGQLVHIDKTTQQLQPAIANSIFSYADAVVLQVGTPEDGRNSGKIRLYGEIDNVLVEDGIVVSYGQKLYLSAVQPGTVTNQPPSTFCQYVGTCIAANPVTTLCSMIFMPDRCTTLNNSVTDLYQDLLNGSIFKRLTVDWLKNDQFTDTANTTSQIQAGSFKIIGDAGQVFVSKNLVDQYFTGHTDRCQLSATVSDSTSIVTYLNNSDNEDEWEQATLSQVHVFSTIRLPANINGTTSFQVDEQVIGQTSNTKAYVCLATSTYLLLRDVIGSGFTSGENVVGSLSGASSTVSGTAIDRTTNSKLRIKFEFVGNAVVYDYAILYELDTTLRPSDPAYEENLETIYADVYESPSFDNDGLANLPVSLQKCKDNLQTFVGSTGDTDVKPTYTSTNYLTQYSNLVAAISQLDNAISASHHLLVPTDGNSTPSLLNNGVICDTVQTSNSSATTITNFTDGYVPMTITIIFGDSFTTIQSGTNIILAGNKDFTGNNNDTLTLVINSDGKWLETGRSLNS